MIDAADGRLMVSAAMTIPNAARLLAQGAELASRGNASFDLAKVEQVDSAGVAVLLGWVRAGKAAGHQVSVSNVPESLMSIATLYGVESLLPIR